MEHLLKEALKTPYGLVLQSANKLRAMQLRRKFYALREKLRQDGNVDYNSLSFIPKPNGELWIVRRDMQQKDQQQYSVRPLEKGELPDWIVARGKRKPGLLAASIFRTLDRKD